VIAKGDLALLQYCFAQGAHLEKELETQGFTDAIKSGNPEIVTELLNHGHQFSMKSLNESERGQLLANAYTSGKMAMLAKVLELEPSPVVTPDLQQQIIKNNDSKALELLESKGFIFDLTKMVLDRNTTNSLFNTGQSGNAVSLELLKRLEKKVLIDLLSQNMDLFLEKDSLHWFQYAIDNEVDPNLQVDTLWGLRPLIFEIIQRQDPELLKILLAKKPDLTVSHNKATVLEHALRRNNQEIIQLIKEASS
jgi:hypothetical protein